MCDRESSEPFCLALTEGQTVDVLLNNADGTCLVRTDAGDVGYAPRAHLLTEDEIYQKFIAEEDARLQAELEEQKRASDKVCAAAPPRDARARPTARPRPAAVVCGGVLLSARTVLLPLGPGGAGGRGVRGAAPRQDEGQGRGGPPAAGARRRAPLAGR